MENIQLRLFNSFKRSGFNENDAMEVATIVEKVSDINDIRKDVSDIKSTLTGIEKELLYLRVAMIIIIALLIKQVFF